MPTVIFKTPILHANISEKDGYVCLSALNDWKPDTDNLTKNIVRPIMELLVKPAFEDAIFDESNVPFKDYDKIKERVREYATTDYTNEQFTKIKKRILEEKAAR